MQIVGLKPVADQLGITTSKLRYFLEREAVVPYRKLDLGGDRHVRYFTPDDSYAATIWERPDIIRNGTIITRSSPLGSIQ